MPFSYERLREIVRGQRLKSVQEVLNVYGNRKGCEVCKPAISYLLDMLWCGEHNEDRSARFIKRLRVHANIQKDGTFSVVPRMRGGVTTPDELRRIADVADKYKVRMVKVTGSQRIDLLGVRKADLPAVWADLGMPSGQAYTKGVRMVKTCVGTEFCRFGTQDSTAAGIELERRLENLFTPHKVKMGAVGCPRNCAEATVKDIGMIGQEGSWQVVVGGAAGKSVRKADLLITVDSTEKALEACELFFQYYRENANYLERAYDFVERIGIETIRKATVYAPDGEKEKLLDRLRRSKSIAKDAWLEGAAPVHPTQFVPCIQAIGGLAATEVAVSGNRSLDARYRHRSDSAARRPRRSNRRERTRRLQSRRPLRDDRKLLSAPGRSAVRWHCGGHVRRLPPARLAFRFELRAGCAQFGARLRRDVPDACGGQHYSK